MASRYVLHLYLFLCTLTEKTFVHKSGEHVLVGVIRVIHSTGWTAMKSCMVARRPTTRAESRLFLQILGEGCCCERCGRPAVTELAVDSRR